ncbi:hypothetical protein, partial [Pseudomonas aeruginosa]|uniref:hypothetical protein n=1 Tax=Pseudomonas aeruginosa TaxID=287 RepID=UPI003EB6DA4A
MPNQEVFFRVSIGFQGIWNPIIQAIQQPWHPAGKAHAPQSVQFDATALGENRQQRQWRCDIQIINLAVTEIVFQQIVQVHLVAGGDTIEP